LLNTNENPYSLPQEVQEKIVEEIEKVAANLNRYPDRDATRLRAKLAEYVNTGQGSTFTGENIWAANGSNEILQTIFLACGGAGRIAVGFTPSYSVHPIIAKITGTEWIAGARDKDFRIHLEEAMAQIRTHKPSLVFLTTPNNPSGTSTSIEEIEELARVTSEVGALFIVDEAYIEFSTVPSASSLINTYPHVISSRTMSKAFAFAGVRLGYLVAHPSVIDAALVTRLPYHLSALTQAAAEVALDHSNLMQSGIHELLSGRETLERGISQVGWRALDSSANFLLFTGFSKSSHEVWQEFLSRGILIRDIGIEGFLRVTVGTPSENERFLASLREIAQ
jgi:histidinol-phosphate aminotransferase